MAHARISIYVQPRASHSEVIGMHGDSVKVRLTAPPVDNAANEALTTFVADALGVPKRQVRWVAGASSRKKELEIEGVTQDQALALLVKAQR